MMKDWSHWGHLADRYRQVRPRRMLALDGGGIRGLISLKVLLRLEELLARHYSATTGISPDQFRLCHFFDYVAGTSTGAILAAGIARGMGVSEILDFYRHFGEIAFTRRRWYARWKSLYGHGKLTEKLKLVLTEEATLEPAHLRTLLLMIARNASSDSAWPITSNPDALYNALDRPDCNLRFPLWKVVRASTAAPVYFAHETIELIPGVASQNMNFVDGGTTAYNNPAFCLARMATEECYRLNWARGEDRLLLVSIGTGRTPSLHGKLAANLASSAMNTVKALLHQGSFDQDLNCRLVGRCTHGEILDQEVGDLIPRQKFGDTSSEFIPLSEPLGRAFLYARYNPELTTAGLERIRLKHILPAAVASLDSVKALDQLEQIGDAVGQQIELNHFGTFVEQPLAPSSLA